MVRSTGQNLQHLAGLPAEVFQRPFMLHDFELQTPELVHGFGRVHRLTSFDGPAILGLLIQTAGPASTARLLFSRLSGDHLPKLKNLRRVDFHPMG